MHHTAYMQGCACCKTRHRVTEHVRRGMACLTHGIKHQCGYTGVQVTHDITHLTCADMFRAPGVQTPVIVRFSTVIHERGSPETLRDPRGFAVKFYTREGNWDMVRGLNLVPAEGF